MKTMDIMEIIDSIKVVINNRNRLTTTKKMVEKLLLLNPQEKIIIIDNGSTYAPLLNWYDEIKDRVDIRLGTNEGHLALWAIGLFKELGDYFIYTDSDIELNDLRIRVQDITSPTSTTFTPNVNTGGISDTENVKYYFTDYPNTDFTLYPIVIRSNEGGAVEFADGSKQTFSAAVIPQVRSGGNRYWLRPEDSGRHILVESTGYSMRIPNWERVTLPVGYTVTIINISGSELTIVNEETNNGIQGELWWSGNDMKTSYVGIDDNGSGQMVTLVKIKEGTRSDSGDDHGDIWMIAGADIFDDF